mgnify:CR=1 FL=1
MANNLIITGRTGEAHVAAIDDAAINKMILGTGNFIFNYGNKFAATMNGANEVQIGYGYLMIQGRLACIRAAQGYEAVAIDNGTVGYYREDVVVMEYYTTTETSTDASGNQVTWTKEHFELKVVKGTPSETAYSEPAITTGNIDSGAVTQMKLWGIKLNGINFDSLVDFRTVISDTALNIVTDAMANIPDIVTNAEATINSTATTAETNIANAKTSAETDITTAKDQAVAAVIAAGGVDAYTKAQTDSLISGFKNITSSTINIPVATWDATNLNCTVSASGVTADNAVVVTPDPASMDVYSAAGIVCTAQAAGTLTFTCKTVPTAAVAVNVMVVG